MNIEVGKAYRTRSGEKVVITALLKNMTYPARGSCKWTTCEESWMENGDYHVSVKEHQHDLIAEWQEPELKSKYKVGDFIKYSDGTKGLIGAVNQDGTMVSLQINNDGKAWNSSWQHPRWIISPWIDPPNPLEFWANVYRDNGLLTCVGNLHLTKEAAEKVSKDAIRTSLFREVL